MRISEYKKLNKDVLLEWTYDSSNIILEPYKVMNNIKDSITSYIASESSITNNNQENQLFSIDIFSNKFAKVNEIDYSFLEINNYVSPVGIQHDIVKIYFPSNWNFDEYQGIYLKLYTFDFRNRKLFEISNFFFDFNNQETENLLSTFSQPLLYDDRNWNKYLQLNVPSINFVSKQRSDGEPTEGSLNSILTNGLGLSQTAPIFIDFQFITKVTQVGQIKQYLTNQKFTTQLPQIPDLQELRLFMEESNNGDYFEIYPTYNNSFSEFVEFVNNSRSIGKFYSLEFEITVFEENIKGKKLKYNIDSDFSEIIEYRPIIKYSTNRATIDVEMKFINNVDGSSTIRKALYGLKPDQLSKYLINTKKINVRNTFKPKIYSKNKSTPYKLDDMGKRPLSENIVKVPVPSLISIKDINKTIASYCEQAINKTSSVDLENYHKIGELKIGIHPFDNIIKFTLVFKTLDSIEPIDLTNCQNIKLVFKNDENRLDFNQYFNEETAANIGTCLFKIPESQFQKVKNFYKLGGRLFYITTTNQGIENILYSGLFEPLDKISANISDDIQLDTSIIRDPNVRPIATVSRARLDSISQNIANVINIDQTIFRSKRN